MSKPFIDSHVVLYLLSGDIAKANQAQQLLEVGGIVSVQVLNEVTSVCQRKLKMPWQEIDAVLQALTAWAARIQQCCLTAIASAFE